MSVPTNQRLHVPQRIITETFGQFRACGQGTRECQVFWIGPRSDPSCVTDVVHPMHRASPDGFSVDDKWLTRFYWALPEDGVNVRVQVHTHPGKAFHSAIDDMWPVASHTGFLSLVIPDFAFGPVGLADAFLTEADEHGGWREVLRIDDRLRIAS